MSEKSKFNYPLTKFKWDPLPNDWNVPKAHPAKRPQWSFMPYMVPRDHQVERRQVEDNIPESPQDLVLDRPI